MCYRTCAIEQLKKMCNYANLLREKKTTATENKNQSVYTKELSAEPPHLKKQERALTQDSLKI